MGFLVNCRLVLAVSCESEAADGANEILRDHLRSYAPGSCLIDYALDGFTPYAVPLDYCEGEAFNGPNLAAEAPAMLAELRDLVAANSGQPRGVTVPALDAARAILARIDATPTAQPAGDTPTGEAVPVTDWNSHAGTITAAQGYVSYPHEWNAPSPRQVAHLLALSGISHGPIAADDWEGEC